MKYPLLHRRCRALSGRVRDVSSRAFSLVEVTMALGIFVFALVAILGLLPTALLASRESLDIATATQLADTLAGEIQRGEFPGPGGEDPGRYFFDDTGSPVTEEEAVYLAEVHLLASQSDNLLRAKILVTRGGGSSNERAFSYLIFNNDV